MVTARFKDARAIGVPLQLGFGRMGCAVDFDDQLRVDAAQIDHKAADRPLPTELPARELSVAQALP